MSNNVKPASGCTGPSDCSEYLVNVTLRIPARLLYRVAKKDIRSKDVQLVSADWDKAHLFHSPNSSIGRCGDE
jgi:hypothetical protein